MSASAAAIEGCVVREGEEEEEDWVPLQNRFSSRRKGEEEEYSLTVTRGSSDSHITVQFNGCLENEESELTEEISFDRLTALHKQMMELFPEDVHEGLLPRLPTVPQGLWSYLLSVDIREGLYDDITTYLTDLAALCSLESVLDVFFANSFWTPDRYEEEWSEVNRKLHVEEKEALQEQWEGLLGRRGTTAFKNMQQLHTFYEEEDEQEYELSRVEGRLLQFQAKPFDDLSEIMRKRRDDAAQRAKDTSQSVSEQTASLYEEREAHEQFLEACECLHELTIDHLRSQAERVEGMHQRMLEDKAHLGKLWDKRAQSRLDRVENKLNHAIVELLRRQCQRLAGQKDRALLAMALVEEGEEMGEEVRGCEEEVYRVQMRLYEVRLRLLEEEEKKIRLQLRYAEEEAFSNLQHRSEAIPSKMAKIRLKMQSCKEELSQPHKRTINVEESYSAPLAAQKKEIATRREEERRRQTMKEQRHKTIQRVKHYMEKHPVPVKKLPPRYQRPSQKQDTRKKAQGRQSGAPAPPPSRVSKTAALTGSVYSKKAPRQSQDRTSTVGKTSVAAKSKGKKTNRPPPGEPVSSSASVGNPPNPPPSAPPPPLPSAPPPPPPPPPPSAPAPPPPSNLPTALTPPPPGSLAKQPVPKLRVSSRQQHTKRTTAGFDLSAIISARKNLKQSKFGAELGSGRLTNTSEEVACLIRSGARPDSSLTKGAADFLSKKIRHINDVVQYSDDESEEELEDWDLA